METLKLLELVNDDDVVLALELVGRSVLNTSKDGLALVISAIEGSELE